MRFLDNIWVRRIFQLRELVAFLLVIVVFVSSPFRESDLVVIFELRDNLLPSQHDVLSDSVRTYLAAPKVLELEFENTTSRRIDDIEVVLNGVKEALSVAAKSSRLSNFQVDGNIELRALTDRRIHLSGLTTLAPRERVQVNVWGDFRPPLFSGIIEISGGFDSIEIRSKEALSSIRLYVAKHLGVILALIGSLLLLIGLRRFQ